MAHCGTTGKLALLAWIPLHDAWFLDPAILCPWGPLERENPCSVLKTELFVNLSKVQFDKKGPAWRLADLSFQIHIRHVIGTRGSRVGSAKRRNRPAEAIFPFYPRQNS